MAGLSLLTLLDDITTVLDDVALMSKMAAKKTSAVLGDDLALNAQQVSGVSAEREIPVVLAVAKGSFRNKFILVPAALLIGAFVPWLIQPLLLIGGLYLSFEGVEKVLESLHSKSAAHSGSQARVERFNGSIEEYEKRKVEGAIRTDFILSAEIIVIALGTVQEQIFPVQIAVVSIIAVIMTIGVYGLVAGIVKLDDLGFYLKKRFPREGFMRSLGLGLIVFAPKLMRVLTVVGTLAMFLVGGGIVVHSFPHLKELIDPVVIEPTQKTLMHQVAPYILGGLVGAVAGLVVVAIKSAAEKLKMRFWPR
ncbi:DUF808 domain-containing protein [Vibrio sp. S4M6]|uniref:DUF808 domain-containing protein n=1 Tax=Vibrio sinus TaxID=2946865 RepID=UPI00202A425C|nr:DUF808 domain-containing protein [Vibrio sinus]MCL9780613.1 DUF808 domain-containing protein [Vibrio sinus]